MDFSPLRNRRGGIGKRAGRKIHRYGRQVNRRCRLVANGNNAPPASQDGARIAFKRPTTICPDAIDDSSRLTAAWNTKLSSLTGLPVP